MAKGQQKTNKEVRKPKKDKAAPVTAAPSGTAVKSAPARLPGSKAK